MELLDHVLGADLPGREESFRPLDQLIGEAKPAGDDERVALPGEPLDQRERRGEGLGVEPHRRRLYPRMAEREVLERGKMGRNEDEPSLLEEGFYYRHPERCPLLGIGPRPELVEEDEGVRIGLGEDRHDVFHVR